MLLIVDGNNLAWAGFFALGKQLKTETEEEKTRAALIGLTQSALGLVARGGNPPEARRGGQAVTGLAVTFDHGRPLRRRQIFPAYQTGRERSPSFMDNEPAVMKAIGEFTELATCLPCRIIRGENTEADDLAAAVALHADGPVRIASSDRDFLQLVDDRISVYSPIKRVVIDPFNFTAETAPKTSAGEITPFPRERYLDYRVASGDASDDLPGIPGIGALTAARLLAKHPLDSYLTDPALAVFVLGRRNVKLEGAIRTGEARRIAERNRRLMDLRLAASRYQDLDAYSFLGTWDELQFQRRIEELRIPRVELRTLIPAFTAMAG